MKKLLKTIIIKSNYLAWFIITSMFIFLFFIGFIFHLFSEQQTERKINSFIVENKKKIENKLKKDIFEYMDENLYRYSRTSTFSLFYEKPDNDLEFLNNIRISLIDSVRTKEELLDIILYRVDDNAVVSAAKSGYSMESIASNFDDVKNVLALGEVAKPKLYATDDNTVTYLFPIYHQNRWQEGAYRGFSMVYFKKPKEFFQTNVSNFQKDGTFALLLGNNILIKEGGNTLSDEVLLNVVESSNENEMIKENISSTDYQFFYTNAEDNIRYLYYGPSVSFIQSLKDNNYFDVYFICNFLVVLFSAIIYRLLSQLQMNYLKQKQTATEYADMLLSNSKPDSIARIVEKYLTIDTKHPNYSCIIVEPDLTYLPKLIDKPQKYIFEEFKDIAKNLFHSMNITYIASTAQSGYLSCVINYEENNSIQSIVGSLSAEINKFSKCPYNIFYTDASKHIQEASQQYIRLLELTKYTYLYNFSHTFSLEELEAMEANTNVVCLNVSETVQSYFNETQPDSLLNYLNNTLFKLRSDGYSFEQAMEFFSTVLLTLKSFMIEKSIDCNLNNSSVQKQLQEFKTLEECIQYIITTLSQYHKKILSTNTPTNRAYMEKILQYIENHIEECTLSLVAEEFKITSAHLSRIFKESMKTNFSEYVSERKILKAAQILRDNKSINTSQLAEMLGYNTPSYFSTKFKEYYGVTPAVYKKQHMNS